MFIMKKKEAVRKSDRTDGDRRERLLRFLLKKWRLFTSPANYYQWPWEEKRWHELAFCLLLSVGSPPFDAATARNTVSALGELGYLDIQELAALVPKCRGPRCKDPLYDVLIQILKRQGLTAAQSKMAVVTIAEAAHSIWQKQAGKLQLYLRGYGERMLAEIDQHFQFSRLSGAQRNKAFTHWFQNVLNIPISLAEPGLKAVCKDFDVTFDELIAVADELGLNLAMLDDMAAAMNRPTDPLRTE